MDPAESRDKIIAEFRRLIDAPEDSDGHANRYLEDLLLSKTVAELRALCAQLNINKVSHDGKINLIVKIRDLVYYASQYRNIQGRLDINTDGAGFLSQNSALITKWSHPNEQDPYDMYRIAVPAAFLSKFNLKQNDIVGGRRRFPYPDGETDLVLVEVYEVNHVQVETDRNSKTTSASAQDDLTEPQDSSDVPTDQSSSDNETSSESETAGQDTGERGPCEQCEHLRTGLSVARPAFDAVLDALKARLQPTYTQKTQEERQASGEFVPERESLTAFNTIEYQKRPTVPRFTFCGLSEFSGKSFCREVKNRDLQCPDFVAKRTLSAPHSCKTCQHNRAPISKLVHSIEEITGSDQKGQPVREMIRQALQYQAETEYQTCVDFVGIVTARPGTLPLCEAYSSIENGNTEPRYIIGPVVNVAERCPRWTPGTNATREKSLTELAQLVTRAQNAVHERQFPAVLDDNVVAATSERQRVAGNAQADVMAYCMRNLGVDPDFIESACNQFTLDVWYSKRQAGGGGAVTSSRQSSAAPASSTPAANTPAQPIQMTINSRYRHPVYTHLTVMVYQYPPWYVAQVDNSETVKFDLFDLSLFKPGIWTRLNGKKGILPIALGVQGPPTNQFFVTWLE